jgi:hypothetical protein
VKYAESEVRRLEAAVTFYRAEFERKQALARTQSVSAAALDKAQFDIEQSGFPDQRNGAGRGLARRAGKPRRAPDQPCERTRAD